MWLARAHAIFPTRDSTGYFTRFFISNQGPNVKNGLKVEQISKQPPTLKTLLQKDLVELLSKNFYSFKFFFSPLMYNHSTYNI